MAPRRRIRSYRFRIPMISREIIFRGPAILNLSIPSFLLSMTDCVLYVLGPLLIILALALIIGLSYSFYAIVLPMISPTGYFTPHALLHQAFVLTIIYNVLFNYYACVTAKVSHRGRNYQRVVRELADVTGFNYPETPEDIHNWKITFRRQILDRGEALRKLEREKLIRKHNLQNTQYNNIFDSNEDLRLKKDGGEKEKLLDGSDGGGGGGGTRDLLTNLEEGHATASTSHSPPDCTSQDISCASPLTAPQKRRATTSTTPVTAKPNTTQLNTKEIKPRGWMLLGPRDWSFCINSKQPKPPRAHYDHVTKSLVLNMDHYCPWMFNVVGYFNYRYFCNFLMYVSIGMIYGTIVSAKPFLNLNGKLYYAQIKHSRKLFMALNATMTNTTLAQGGDHLLQPLTFKLSQVKHMYPYVPTPAECTTVAFTFLLCSCVGIAVLLLFAFHLYLILTAQTTIEFHGNYIKKRTAKAHGQPYVNPYHLGYKKNLEQVWGLCNNNRHSSRVMNLTVFLWKILAPSFREPEFLPVPLVGGLRRCHPKSKEDSVDLSSDYRSGKRMGRSDAAAIV